MVEKKTYPKILASDDHTIIGSVDEKEDSTPLKPQYEPPYIIVVEGPRTGARFPLFDGPNVIGRTVGAAVRLDDQSVSRQHAEVMKADSGWIIKDLGSKNGTLVNGNLLTELVIIGHKDIIKTGIYQLRLITQPITAEEEMILPQEILTADRTVFVAAPPDGLTSEIHKETVADKVPRAKESAGVGKLEVEVEPSDVKKSPFDFNKRQLILFGTLSVVLIVAAVVFGKQLFFKSKPSKNIEPPMEQAEQMPPSQVPVLSEQPPSAPEQPPPPEQQGGASEVVSPPAGVAPPPPVAPSTVPAAPENRLPLQPTIPPANVQTIPVFLDFASSPMPAKVIFQDKELGVTPLRVNVELEAGKTYQAQALFIMKELNQNYTQKVDFTVERDKSVVPILFRGPVGILKVNTIPRDVEFYLEGKFSYDKFQEQSAKLQEIVLQKPIYVPFGSYILELRRSRQLGQSSSTYVADIIFKRDFQIAEDSPSYTLDVKDDDLKIFPAKIRSDPSNADVFVDNKSVGKTPYDGNIPLGEHKLTVRKEGYFEHTEDLKIDLNTPFIADIKLKTSIAGAHINNARQAINRAMYQDAINELAEALNSSPAPTEVALANYLLGQSYIKMGDIERARGYFEQAKNDEAQKYPAMLGLVNCYALTQKMDVALPLLVEVLLKGKDEDVKREANALFQKVSPFKSVLYVYSDPPGAKVVVNDKPVAQITPVILHELPLGNYKLKIEKAGYLPTDLNLSLSVNEFNPVVVKLKPIPQ